MEAGGQEHQLGCYKSYLYQAAIDAVQVAVANQVFEHGEDHLHFVNGDNTTQEVAAARKGDDPSPNSEEDEEEVPGFVLHRAKMKLAYDATHCKPKFDTGWAYLKIARTANPGYYPRNQTKLSFQKIGLFKILQCNPLSCELGLPVWLSGIYPVMSVDHLEPAMSHAMDPYFRPNPSPGPLTVNGVVNTHWGGGSRVSKGVARNVRFL